MQHCEQFNFQAHAYQKHTCTHAHMHTCTHAQKGSGIGTDINRGRGRAIKYVHTLNHTQMGHFLGDNTAEMQEKQIISWPHSPSCSKPPLDPRELRQRQGLLRPLLPLPCLPGPPPRRHPATSSPPPSSFFNLLFSLRFWFLLLGGSFFFRSSGSIPGTNPGI